MDAEESITLVSGGDYKGKMTIQSQKYFLHFFRNDCVLFGFIVEKCNFLDFLRMGCKEKTTR